MTSPVPYRTGTLAAAPSPADGVDLKEAVLGNLGLWTALGLSLLILGFAAGIALDTADDGGAPSNALAGIPALLVALLPFVAAPVLALGTGAWSGHATRSPRLGAVGGALGGLLGPIILVLLAGLGLAFGAGAAGVDLDAARMPYNLGNVGDWRDALGYLVSGAGILVLLASVVSGAVAGWVVGAMLEGRWARWRTHGDRPDARPPVRI